MKKNLSAIMIAIIAVMAITISCKHPQPDELIIGTWKVDTIMSENVDTSMVSMAQLQQALAMQQQVYFVIHENGQMDLVSPFGAKTANWEMNNDSLILRATFIDNKQVSEIQFDEITAESLVLVEKSKSGIFTTMYKKQ